MAMMLCYQLWTEWILSKVKQHASVLDSRLSPSQETIALTIAVEYVFCVSTPRGLTRHIIKRVCWEKPPHGWVKLNTDRAAAGNSGLAGCGGLLRDEHGNWLAGFARRIGTTTGFVAVLWGLRDGLSLCYNLNIYLPSLLSLMPKQLLIFFRNQTMKIT